MSRGETLPRIFLVLGSLVFSLILAEGLVRLLGPDSRRTVQWVRVETKEDPRFDSSYHKYLFDLDPPGYRHNPLYPEFNECGLFPRDVPLRARPGEFRILVLGDSVTEQACGMEDGFTAVLERELNRVVPEGRRTVVINAGHGGYNLRQSVAFYQRCCASLEIDLLLLAFVNNDLGSPEIRHKEEGRVSVGYREPRSVPMPRDLGWANAWVYGRWRTGALAAGVLAGALEDPTRPWPRYVDLQDDNLRALRELSAGARRQNLPLVFVHFPVHTNKGGYHLAPQWALHGLMEQLCRELQLPRLDLWKVFQDQGGAGLFDAAEVRGLPEAFHPNEAGHRLAGEEIAAWLIARKLVPIRKLLK